MTKTAKRLRVAYGQCSECRVIAEYYYDLDDNSQWDLAFIENCIKCNATPKNLFQVTVTKGNK
jgi:hypothetical protein